MMAPARHRAANTGPAFCPALLLLLAALLSGCALQAPTPGAGALPSSNLDHWRLEGKLGFRDSRESGSAWIDWRQQGDSFQVQLNGPLGTGATRISGDPQHALLQQAGADDVRATGPEDLARRLFGWSFPVRQLRYWATGIADPAEPVVMQSHSDSGALTSLVQAGWQLTFSRHGQQGPWLLPGKISGASDQGEFTLVIKRWQLETSED